MKKILYSLMLTIGLLAIPVQTMAQVFNDVYAEHINKDAIEYLQEKKVVEGYEDGNYKAENRINRAEFVKILVESQIQNPSGSFCFDDVKDEWYAPYICTAKRLGYIKGYSDNTFKPGQNINFAEASKIITKVLKIEPDTTGTNGEWYAGFVNSLGKNKAIPTTVQFFDRDISRGEMAEMIWRLKEEKKDKVSQDYETLTEELPPIKSCEVLKDKFATYQSYQYRGGGRFIDNVMVMEAMEDSSAQPTTASNSLKSGSNASGGATSEGAANDFSTTNIQVKGVDEADIIKNDGKFIYAIKGNTVRIIQAFPANEMKQVGKIEFKEENFNPSEMFLNGDQLVVIGNSWVNYNDNVVKSLIAPYRIGSSRTKVYVIDITDRSQPKEWRKLSFEGNYHTSRRLDNQMILVMNQYPNFWALDNIRSGKDLLPQFEDGDKGEQALVDCGDIRYFPGHADPNYLIIASIPLDDQAGEINREVLLGSSNNVYSSLGNLYVAANEVNYDYYTDWDWREDNAHTLVFKFNLADKNIKYESRGRVPGRILNQFSMDEHKNHFRIATTIDSWNSDKPSTNQVYVMDENMKVTGKIEDIAPGERIFSTRFLGDRLYMVTFRQVDPLFVITLKDPENPRLLGQLKIPGFSDYLHPFDENHIIGFGKETEETKTGAVLTKGFKMALFDVSNVSSPKQKFVEVIGDRGTDSELLRNHKALLFDKEKQLLAFPINIVEKVNSEALECTKSRFDSCPSLCQQQCIPTSCTEDAEGRAVCTDDCNGLGSCQEPQYDRYNTTFSGAVVYNLNETKGFQERGKITHYDETDILKMGDYWPYNFNRNIQRILFIDKNLYTVSQSKIKANDMTSIKEINEVKLSE